MIACANPEILISQLHFLIGNALVSIFVVHIGKSCGAGTLKTECERVDIGAKSAESCIADGKYVGVVLMRIGRKFGERRKRGDLFVTLVERPIIIKNII